MIMRYYGYKYFNAVTSLELKGRFWLRLIHASIQLFGSGPAGVPGIRIAPTVDAPSFEGEPPQL